MFDLSKNNQRRTSSTVKSRGALGNDSNCCSVAMIEADLLGGTCPNRGCTPKKVLVAAGHALHEIERASIHHIAVGKPKLDWAALIGREKDMIKDIPTNLARSMARRNVEVIKGQAAFTGPNSIRVGDRELEAKHIVIATGSKPRTRT